ncbi:mannan-binding protein [Spartinivicinus poritis]|uniref:Mannan-binding protein domain-containing protein n=1 Tax=Spartinivicinus poritis TaxID=2994640 RepID=A0ABT5UGZ6_9GAMM|nr:mannan-binding protein [Spartinivicinus sp. A2-2]MDE1465638.1 hypothetical protein [Spartinivicinus sp. A2-2]
MCLEAGGNLQQGATAFIYQCHSATHQRWRWSGYTIQNQANPSLVLDYFVDSGRVGVWSQHNRSNQKWFWQSAHTSRNTPSYQQQNNSNYQHYCNTKDYKAGPIWDQQHANRACPDICRAYNAEWTGHWNTIEWNTMSVCQCKRC